MRNYMVLSLLLAVSFPATAENSNNDSTQGLAAAGCAVTSYNQFSLIRFEKKKDKRDAVISSVGIGGSKAGLRDKDQIDFEADQISPDVYKIVSTTMPLLGEYECISDVIGAGANASFRLFDFTVN